MGVPRIAGTFFYFPKPKEYRGNASVMKVLVKLACLALDLLSCCDLEYTLVVSLIWKSPDTSIKRKIS